MSTRLPDELHLSLGDIALMVRRGEPLAAIARSYWIPEELVAALIEEARAEGLLDRPEEDEASDG